MFFKRRKAKLCEIVDVDYLGGHRLHLRFNDGLEGSIDLSDFVKRGVFKPLEDPKKFTQFDLIYGTIVWKPDREDLDVAPEHLYWQVHRSKPYAKWGFDYFTPEHYQQSHA